MSPPRTSWAEIVLWQNGKVLHSFYADEPSVDIGKQFLVSNAFQNSEPHICTITKVKNGCEVVNQSYSAIYVVTGACNRPGSTVNAKHTPKDLAKGETSMLFWDTAFVRQLKEASSFDDLQDKNLQSLCFSKIEFKRNGEQFGIGITFLDAWEKIRTASAAKMFGLDNTELNRTVSLSQSDTQRFKLPVFKPSSSPLRNRSSLAPILDRDECRPRKSSIVRDMVNSFTTQMENKENHLTPSVSTVSLAHKSDSETLPPHSSRSSVRRSNQLYLSHKRPILQQSFIDLDEEIKILDLAVLKLTQTADIHLAPSRKYKKGSRSIASESTPDEYILQSEVVVPKIRTFSIGTAHPEL